VVAATFNTINKFALGIADTRVLTILGENLGRERPVLAVPCVNQDHLARHPAFSKSLTTLREWGVHVLFDLETYPPRNEVPWHVFLETFYRIIE
jgi:phosphopantothenoylcysteine synthetase/decarboxylase